jgi:hypothetical protein
MIDDKDSNPEDYKTFMKLLDDIDGFAESVDKISDKLVLSDKNWFFGSMMKMMMK